MATTKFIESGSDATQGLEFYSGTVTSNGTLGSDSAQFKDGLRSIKADVTLSGGEADAQTPSGTLTDAGSLISNWVRFSSVSPATPGMFMKVADSGGTALLGVGITGGKLRICGRGATAVDGSTTLLANTWYRISLGYVFTSASVWSAVVYLNGVSEATTSNTQGNLAATASDNFRIGLVGSGSVDTFGTVPVLTVWYDSIYIDNRTDKSDCGNVHVTAKRPNANGTTNGFTTQIGSGGSGYGTGHSPQVNEQPLNIANGWSIAAAGGAKTEEYNIEGASVGDVNISGATLVDYMGWVYTSATVSETGKIRVNNVDTSISVTSTNTMFTAVAGSSTYPAGSGTDIGEVTAAAVTTASLYECGIVFAYIPAVASTKSVSFKTLLGAGNI